MQIEFYDNIRTLLDCFIEGILIIDSENRMTVNKGFKNIFNIEHIEMPNIVETLDQYGLIDILESNISVEKNICINDRKIIFSIGDKGVQNFNVSFQFFSRRDNCI